MSLTYLAGPMSTLPLFNFPAFDAAQADLEAQGYTVVSPAQMDRDIGFDPERDAHLVDEKFLDECLQRDIDAIRRCDRLVLLPGWETSTGANAEMWVARWLHKPVYLYPTMAPLEKVYPDPHRTRTGLTPLPDEHDHEDQVPHALVDAHLEYQIDAREAAEEDRDRIWREIQNLQIEGALGRLSEALNENPKELAGRKKCQMNLLPLRELMDVADVHYLGSEKYGKSNWRQDPIRYSTYIGAILRHLTAWQDGEDIDPESGKSHLSHIVASCLIVRDATRHDSFIDDRAETESKK